MTNDPAHLYSGINPGVEVIHRAGIVRLGPGGPELYYPTNHGALGVTGADIDDSGYLRVTTGFGPDETCVHASANVDLTLARKGVFCGASGGAAVTRFGIYSTRRPSPTGGVFPNLRPDDSLFDPAADNLWLHFISTRPVSAE